MGKPKRQQRKGQGNSPIPEGILDPSKGGWGKGGKGAFGLEDDWSEGLSGYNWQQGYSADATALFQLAREAQSGWQFPNPKKTCNPTWQKEQACGGRNSELVTRCRYAALAGNQDQYDLGIPIAA